MANFIPEVTGVEADRVKADPKFLNWLSSLDPEYTVESVEVQAATFVAGRLLFATLNCNVHDKNGPVQGGIVFLRGGAAAVLVVLLDEDYNCWTVLTAQNRFPAGRVDLCEIPAGMLDEADGQFKGAAARELKEETGLDVTDADNFYCLGSVYLSPGGCDEKIALFVAEFRLYQANIKQLVKLVETAEGERISLKIVPLEDLLDVAHSDAKSQLAYYRYVNGDFF